MQLFGGGLFCVGFTFYVSGLQLTLVRPRQTAPTSASRKGWIARGAWDCWVPEAGRSRPLRRVSVSPVVYRCSMHWYLVHNSQDSPIKYFRFFLNWFHFFGACCSTHMCISAGRANKKHCRQHGYVYVFLTMIHGNVVAFEVVFFLWQFCCFWPLFFIFFIFLFWHGLFLFCGPILQSLCGITTCSVPIQCWTWRLTQPRPERRVSCWAIPEVNGGSAWGYFYLLALLLLAYIAIFLKCWPFIVLSLLFVGTSICWHFCCWRILPFF